MRMLNIQVLLLLVLGWTTISCDDDKGNYDYHDLDEVTIEGVVSDTTVLAFDRLLICPRLDGMEISEEYYDFEWKAVRTSGNREEQVIATTRNLDYQVELQPGLYTLLYTVREKGSSVYYQKLIHLRISSVTSEGWLVLCSDNNEVRLGMFSKVTGKTYPDLLEGTQAPAMHGPRAVMYLPPHLISAASPFYILAEDGAIRLGENDFEWKPEFDFKYEMGSGKPVFPYSISAAATSKMFVGGTKAYFCDNSLGETMGNQLYGSAIATGCKVAPVIGCNVSTRNIFLPFFLMYDTDNNKFLWYNTQFKEYVGLLLPDFGLDGLEMLAEMGMPVISGTKFELPTGYDYVYMENTKYDPDGTGTNGMTYTVLADGGRRYLYGFQMGDLYAGESLSECLYQINKSYYGDLSACTDIAQASHFAFSSLKNQMYYSVGGKVYRVNLSNQTLSSELQFELSGEIITCLKFYLYTQSDNANKSYDLIVGGYKAGDETSSGVLRIYEGFDSGGDFRDVQPEIHDGFAKITDVIYRELLNK